MATRKVSGIGTVRGSVGCDGWKPPCSSSRSTCSSSTSEPSAIGSSRANKSGSSAGTALGGPGRPQRVDDRVHQLVGGVGVGHAGPLRRVGDVGDLRREPVDHRRVAGQLRQHRHQDPGVGLAQVGPQFVGASNPSWHFSIEAVPGCVRAPVYSAGHRRNAVGWCTPTVTGMQFHDLDAMTARARSHGLGDIPRRSARRQPDKTAIIDGDVVLTFAEFENLVDRAAAALHDNGFRARGPHCVVVA